MQRTDFKRVVEDCDVILEVLDARDVEGTRSSEMENLVLSSGKTLILVINKCDLVPKEQSEKAKRELLRKGRPVIFMSAKQHLGTRLLKEGILKHAKKPDVLVGVVGYANVGKSSIISALKGRMAARISPKPGFTRGVQIVKISDRLRLLDTPGLIPMKEGEARLALIGSYDPSRLKDPVDVALKVLDMGFYENLPEEDSYEALETLARRWNMLLKGGEPDINRAARRVLEEWQRRRETCE